MSTRTAASHSDWTSSNNGALGIPTTKAQHWSPVTFRASVKSAPAINGETAMSSSKPSLIPVLRRRYLASRAKNAKISMSPSTDRSTKVFFAPIPRVSSSRGATNDHLTKNILYSNERGFSGRSVLCRLPAAIRWITLRNFFDKFQRSDR